MQSRRKREAKVIRFPRRRRGLSLVLLIAALLAAMWAVRWYFFTLPEARTARGAGSSPTATAQPAQR